VDETQKGVTGRVVKLYKGLCCRRQKVERSLHETLVTFDKDAVYDRDASGFIRLTVRLRIRGNAGRTGSRVRGRVPKT
jgi:hypothetical protein